MGNCLGDLAQGRKVKRRDSKNGDGSFSESSNGAARKGRRSLQRGENGLKGTQETQETGGVRVKR